MLEPSFPQGAASHRRSWGGPTTPPGRPLQAGASFTLRHPGLLLRELESWSRARRTLGTREAQRERGGKGPRWAFQGLGQRASGNRARQLATLQGNYAFAREEISSEMPKNAESKLTHFSNWLDQNLYKVSLCFPWAETANLQAQVQVQARLPGGGPPPPRGRRRPQDAAVSLRRGLSSCLSPKCNLSLRWGPGSCKGCVRAGKWVPLVLRRLLSCLPPPGASCRQGGSQSRGPREPGPQRAAAEGGSG